MNRLFILIFLSFQCLLVISQPIVDKGSGLSGPLSGTLFGGIAYLVNGDIEVLEEDTLTLVEGTELLFLKDLMFTIRGTLIVQGEYNDSVVFSSAIEEETWAGLKIFEPGKADLSYLIIEHANSSGIYSSGECKIDHSYIRNNSGETGGGIRMNTGRSVNITNSRIYRNTANIGGAIYLGYITEPGISGERPYISNNLIYDNTANEAAGIFFYIWYYGDFRPPLITNCTFSANACLNPSGIIESDPQSAIPSMINNIIAHNTGYGLVFENEAYFYGFNNCFGNSLGNYYDPPEQVGINVATNINGDSCDAFHNIHIDPEFEDTYGFDFHLLSSSPCIDAGLNDSVFSDLDLDGNTRIFDAHEYGIAYVDMGPYEYDEIIVIGVSETIPGEQLISIYPNPTTGQLYLDGNQMDNVQIFDLSGKELIEITEIGSKVSIDLSNYKNGIYLIRANIGNGEILSYKVLKQE